jgi:hypothetical protein
MLIRRGHTGGAFWYCLFRFVLSLLIVGIVLVLSGEYLILGLALIVVAIPIVIISLSKYMKYRTIMIEQIEKIPHRNRKKWKVVLTAILVISLTAAISSFLVLYIAPPNQLNQDSSIKMSGLTPTTTASCSRYSRLLLIRKGTYSKCYSSIGGETWIPIWSGILSFGLMFSIIPAGYLVELRMYKYLKSPPRPRKNKSK